jgi:hypothetical protein
MRYMQLSFYRECWVLDLGVVVAQNYLFMQRFKWQRLLLKQSPIEERSFLLFYALVS